MMEIEDCELCGWDVDWLKYDYCPVCESHDYDEHTKNEEQVESE